MGNWSCSPTWTVSSGSAYFQPWSRKGGVYISTDGVHHHQAQILALIDKQGFFQRDHIPFPLLIGLQVGLDPLFAEYYILQLGLHPQRQTEKRVGKQKKDGVLYVLLSNTNNEKAGFVQKRFLEAGYESSLMEEVSL